jgi:uncharacterized protein
LLGIKRAHRRLFDDIDWSTERVAAQTMERARELELPVHVLPSWYDVDEVDALRTLHSELCGGRSFAAGLRSHRAPRTADLLRALVRDSGLADRLDLAPSSSAERIAG